MNFDYIVSFGAFLNGTDLDAKNIISCHPLEQSCKKHISYEPFFEECIMAVLVSEILDLNVLNKDDKEFLSCLDKGNICSESNISEEEIQDLANGFKTAVKPLLIIGADLSYHAKAGHIFYLLSLLEKHSEISLKFLAPKVTPQKTLDLVVPLETNTLIYVLKAKTKLLAPPQFFMATKTKPNQELTLKILDKKIKIKAQEDKQLKGTTAILYLENWEQNAYSFFEFNAITEVSDA